jgi:hypothetical protein
LIKQKNSICIFSPTEIKLVLSIDEFLMAESINLLTFRTQVSEHISCEEKRELLLLLTEIYVLLTSGKGHVASCHSPLLTSVDGRLLSPCHGGCSQFSLLITLTVLNTSLFSLCDGHWDGGQH